MMPHAMIVLFDGGCPLCRREILHYRRIARDLPIEWIDVTQPDAGPDRFGIDLATALQWFHVQDRAGHMQVGVRAFIALWAELPRYRRLARLGRAPGVTPLLEFVYARFARWHFRRRCRDGVCGVPQEKPAA